MRFRICFNTTQGLCLSPFRSHLPKTLLRPPHFFAAVLIWLMLPLSTQAAETNQNSTSPISQSANVEKSQCLATPLLGWQKRAYRLEDTRDQWSDQVDLFARNMDAFFAGPDNLAHLNESYIQLTLGGQWGERGSFDDKTDIKFRLDLPATEKKYKLVIENSSEERESLVNKNRPSLIGNQSDANDFSAFLQRNKQLSDWDSSGRIGIKGVFDPFARFDLERHWTLNDTWHVPYRFRVAYFHSDGFRAINSLAFQRSLSPSLLFEGKTDISWLQERDTLDAAQAISLIQQLSPQQGMSYTLGIFEESFSNTVISDYFVSAHYRQLVYKDWLYVNIIPEVNFPREFDYDARLSVTLKLEVFFQQNKPH